MFFLTATALLLAFACGNPEIVNNIADDGSTGGAGGSGGGDAVGGTGNPSGGSGGTINFDGSIGEGGAAGENNVIDPDAACGTGTAEATLTPLTLFVMFDRSGSMDQETTTGGPSRWEVASAALDAFFSSPDAAGLKIALRFFGYNEPETGCNRDDCSIEACAVPNVDVGTLTADAAPMDAHEQALLDAVVAAAPTGGTGTPIFAALGGAVQWATANAAANADEKTAIIFVTDGDPEGCESDAGLISDQAATAFAAGVPTYGIGLSGDMGMAINPDVLNQIAEKGGTTAPTFIADGDDTEQQLIDTLNAIRGQSLDCDFPMPESQPNRPVDPQKINVNFTPTGGDQVTFGQVQDESECGTATDAWYYDDPDAPTRIVLCADTCAAVQADASAKLEILLGCEVQIKIPQ